MIEFICLFFPAFIMYYILDNNKDNTNYINFLEHYSIYNIIINVIVLFAIIYLNEGNYYLFNGDAFTVSFSLKYLSFASLVSVLLSILIKYTRKNIKINIRQSEKKK